MRRGAPRNLCQLRKVCAEIHSKSVLWNIRGGREKNWWTTKQLENKSEDRNTSIQINVGLAQDNSIYEELVLTQDKLLTTHPWSCSKQWSKKFLMTFRTSSSKSRIWARQNWTNMEKFWQFWNHWTVQFMRKENWPPSRLNPFLKHSMERSLTMVRPRLIKFRIRLNWIKKN